MKRKLKKLITGKAGKIILVILGIGILYYTMAASERNKAMNKIIAKMKKDSGWFASEKNKAKINNISLDEQLRMDAVWVLRNDSNYKGLWWNF